MAEFGRVEVDMLLVWLMKGWVPFATLGLLKVAIRSNPKEELRLLATVSKCPERFSRSEVCML